MYLSSTQSIFGSSMRNGRKSCRRHCAHARRSFKTRGGQLVRKRIAVAHQQAGVAVLVTGAVHHGKASPVNFKNSAPLFDNPVL